LPVAIAPVLVGAAMGWGRGDAIAPGPALIVLAAALLIQLTTNLQNDVGYTLRGGDASGTRTGLPRATAQRWLGVAQVRVAIAGVVALALALGASLVAYRGWPVVAIGSASLLAALAYMGGPRPIAYTPFGELTAFLFFGPVAVVGTDWVLTGHVDAVSGVAGVACGCFAAAALAVNNQRDASHDRGAGRSTFAVRFGSCASSRLYALLLVVPFGLTVPLALNRPWHALPLLLVPTAWSLWRDFRRATDAQAYTGVLFRCFDLGLKFAALLAASACLARWTG
jgi:1,4-dihydroxy-2-naphthoate octaprenyltransferase